MDLNDRATVAAALAEAGLCVIVKHYKSRTTAERYAPTLGLSVVESTDTFGGHTVWLGVRAVTTADLYSLPQDYRFGSNLGQYVMVQDGVAVLRDLGYLAAYRVMTGTTPGAGLAQVVSDLDNLNREAEAVLSAAEAEVWTCALCGAETPEEAVMAEHMEEHDETTGETIAQSMGTGSDEVWRRLLTVAATDDPAWCSHRNPRPISGDRVRCNVCGTVAAIPTDADAGDDETEEGISECELNGITFRGVLARGRSEIYARSEATPEAVVWLSQVETGNWCWSVRIDGEDGLTPLVDHVSPEWWYEPTDALQAARAWLGAEQSIRL